jgi:hypothetical protein
MKTARRTARPGTPRARRSTLFAVAALALLAAPVVLRAEVVARGPTGFQLRYAVASPLPPQAAYERFLAIGRWWSDAHTYSGQASALRIDAVPGGCWCETLPDAGGVRHMTVAVVLPGQSLVFGGGLGPLLSMGVHGAMSVGFKARDAGSQVAVTYNVSGFAPADMDKMANLVDQVLTEQLGRFAAQR